VSSFSIGGPVFSAFAFADDVDDLEAFLVPFAPLFVLGPVALLEDSAFFFEDDLKRGEVRKGESFL
jgi:hypothetical protein